MSSNTDSNKSESLNSPMEGGGTLSEQNKGEQNKGVRNL